MVTGTREVHNEVIWSCSNQLQALRKHVSSRTVCVPYNLPFVMFYFSLQKKSRECNGASSAYGENGIELMEEITAARTSRQKFTSVQVYKGTRIDLKNHKNYQA